MQCVVNICPKNCKAFVFQDCRKLCGHFYEKNTKKTYKEPNRRYGVPKEGRGDGQARIRRRRGTKGNETRQRPHRCALDHRRPLGHGLLLRVRGASAGGHQRLRARAQPRQPPCRAGAHPRRDDPPRLQRGEGVERGREPEGAGRGRPLLPGEARAQVRVKVHGRADPAGRGRRGLRHGHGRDSARQLRRGERHQHQRAL